MPFCRNCGAELEESAKFCPECGTAQTAVPDEETVTPPIVETVTPPKSSGVLNVGMLVWSILNLVFCCMPLAIVSLIMTVTAKDAPTPDEEAKRLKTAKTCNLIATIGAAVFYFLYFIAYLVFVVILGVLVI